jgi:tetratricopeptide (TPR) repeat protein
VAGRLVVTGYDDELAATKRDVANLVALVREHPDDSEKRVRLAYRQFHRASLTCRPADFAAVEAAITDAIRSFGALEDICLLQATLNLRFHRLAAAKASLEMQPGLALRPQGRMVLADCDFQEGRYERARTALESLVEKNPTWDCLARLAHWDAKMGRAQEADALYARAQDELTAKEMRAYAWLELQRGELRAAKGSLDEARAHYERAEAAYPGHWQTGEHFAALYVAQDDLSKAVALLRNLVEGAPKPELKQTLGEVLVLLDEADQAREFFEEALTEYLESVSRGDVHFYHHLVDFYIRARPDPAEAVIWARRDVALRSNFSTQRALADALRRSGQIAEALQHIGEALSSGVREWAVFATAAEVFDAAGQPRNSERYARAADELNPHGRRLHLHR